MQVFLLDHARMLLNEYRGDGLRFDMAHNLTWDCTEYIHEDEKNSVLAFKRWHETGDIVVAVVNMSDRQWQSCDYGVHMGGETGQWEEIFNSQARQYDGWNDSGNYGHNPWVQGDGKLYVNLPQWSILMFRKHQLIADGTLGLLQISTGNALT